MTEKVTILLFAGARTLAGAETVEVALAHGATYRDLAEAIADKWPALTDLVAGARFAADASYTRPDDAVNRAAEIALIPPVSGG